MALVGVQCRLASQMAEAVQPIGLPARNDVIADVALGGDHNSPPPQNALTRGKYP